MVVNISKKLEAGRCRVQIVGQGAVTQMIVFFEGWSIADALVLQLRGTDVYEKVKADKGRGGNEGGAGGRFGVKMVDAKFTLPKKEKHEVGDEGTGADAVVAGGEGTGGFGKGVRRRFVNLEMLEYAEEHDDITIGFESEEGEFWTFFPILATLPRALRRGLGSCRLFSSLTLRRSRSLLRALARSHDDQEV